MSSPSVPSPRDSNAPVVDNTPLCDGRFIAYRRLGSGSQAQTYEGVDRLNGCVVAIKRFDVQGASSWKDVDLAEREARVLATLQHPALPRYVHHFEEAGALYLVMERVEGQDLAKRLEAGQRFSYDELLLLVQTLADVFVYLHQRSPPIVHRDIKPSNIVQRPDGSYSVIDFGSVRDGLRPAGGSTVVGTFGFMAPEQFQGRAMPATDWYGAGATLLTLMTGVSPELLPHRGLELDVRSSLPASTPRAWIDLLERLLRADPDQRSFDWQTLLPGLRAASPAASASHRAGTASHPDGHAASPNWSRPDNAGTQPDASNWSHYWSRPNHAGAPSNAAGSDTDPRTATRLSSNQPEWLFAGGTTIPWFIVLVLSLLRVALFVALQVTIPTLLTLLSVLFGKPMRQAATDVSRAGEHANQQLGVVIQRLSQAGPFTVRRRYVRPGHVRPERSRTIADEVPGPTTTSDARRARRIRVGSFDVELPTDPPSESTPEPPRRKRL